MSNRYPVVLLPGGVLPAELAYAALLERLGDRVDAVVKDLEIYAADARSAARLALDRARAVLDDGL